MNKESVDVEHLTVTGATPQTDSVSVRDEVVVIINQAYGPTGEKLVGISDVDFDGFPALTLLVKGGGDEGLVHLSPIHGDHRKKGVTFPSGTKCELFCPVSRQPLDRVDADEDGDAEHFVIYLSSKLSSSSAVYLSNVWDDYNSRVIDNDELVSAYTAD